MGAHHGAMKRLVVGQQGFPAHASAKHRQLVSELLSVFVTMTSA